ncbi:ergosterol biosynthesis protein [Rhodotorula toruloides]
MYGPALPTACFTVRSSSSLATDLPPTSGGNLPNWMLFVSGLAIFNGVQNYLTTRLTAQVYARRPAWVNPLQARLFGVWTLMSAFVRLYAAYHIHSKPIYDLTIISYILALGHFASEALVFRTVGLKGVFFPFVVASSSLYWMITQYDFYVRL